MADLAQLLDAQLSAGLADFTLGDVPSLHAGELFTPGLSRTANVTELAELLAGTEDRKSKAYRSARRQVERWEPSPAARARGVKPRAPSPVSLRRIAGARRQQDDRLRQYRQRGADVRLQVSWYAARKAEWLPPHRWLHIPREAMRQVIRYWSEGEHELASGALFGAFIAAYRVPNYDDWARDVEPVDLRLQPSG